MWLALKHHKTHKKNYLNFKTHPYQIKIYHDKSPYIAIIKSTQNGISEYLLVRALAHAISGMNVFYVLPTFELVKRSVDERYTKSVENTMYYRQMVRMVKDEMDVKQTESVKSKDIGNGNIAFVNSGSSSGFTEYPADEIIIDELDKCDNVNVEMAIERLAASEYRWQIKISNPTYKNTGIDAEFKDTDRQEWYVKCPSGHDVKLDWFKHIVRQTDDNRYVIRDEDWNWDSERDVYPMCDKCGKPIDRKSKGIWIPGAKSDKRGYRLTKLFSGTVTIFEMMDRFQKGLKNDNIMQRFYNADLGEAFTAKGSSIDEEMISSCIRDYREGKEDGLIIAGIDVGTYYHFVIKKIMPDQTLKTLLIHKVIDTDELISVLKDYKVVAGVIDGLPETREAKKISRAFKLMVLCYFGNVKSDSINLVNRTITVQRTPSIDAVKEAVLTNVIQYPININSNKEFIEHMTSSVRVYNADRRVGGQIGAYEWVEGSNPDHYLLATAYCLIARRLLVLLKR